MLLLLQMCADGIVTHPVDNTSPPRSPIPHFAPPLSLSVPRGVEYSVRYYSWFGVITTYL